MQGETSIFVNKLEKPKEIDEGKLLTCNWLCNNGGVMMRVVARIEIVMMQSSVKPIVQKLHWPCV